MSTVGELEISHEDMRRKRRRQRGVAVIVPLVIGAGVALAVSNAFTASGQAGTSGVTDNADPTSLATVTRQELSSQAQVPATLGYAGSYTVVNQAQGTMTAVPAVGQVISQGQVLYRVNGNPVVLLYGATPAYRSLEAGVSGTDIQELNADLVALGYATSRQVDAASDYFSAGTTAALERLQQHLGENADGTLALGQAVFLPTEARVTAVPAGLGGPAQPGQQVLQASSTARQVSIALDADEQSEVAVGDHVTIVLPDNQATPGVISSVGTVATTPAATPGSTGSSPTITVLVNPADPAATGDWDQAPVTVTITTATVADALVVPIDALLAEPDGDYAVEVATASGVHKLIAVSLGLFDDADGLVQVTGPALRAGQHVVVPAL
jgi:Putative peptidoglycan binding domain